MTRKDFEFIAGTLLATMPEDFACYEGMMNQEHIVMGDAGQQWCRMVSEFADLLEVGNPRFKKTLFKYACGLTEEIEEADIQARNG